MFTLHNVKVLFQEITSRARKDRCSDIHIECYKTEARIRVRKDGSLSDLTRFPLPTVRQLIGHIKVLARLDVAEKRLPQDGKIRTDEGLDVRVSSVPSLHGEKIVLRLLDTASVTYSLDAIGLDKKQQTIVSEALNAPQGLVLVTGPTGSGKTTTIYAALQRMNKPDVNILTIEDPVEYEISEITQTQLNDEIGYTFPKALRAFLRQDPDVIFVGEIRDETTAQIAIRAALTGHLVLSTLHTNSAVESITRLLDMGVQPYLLAATLRLVVAQRLVRRTRTGTGEQAGRMGVFEILSVSQRIQDAIHRQAAPAEFRALLKSEHFIDLQTAGEGLLERGLTTREELIRVLS